MSSPDRLDTPSDEEQSIQPAKRSTTLEMGDRVLLVTHDNKRYLLRLQNGSYLNTHHGRFLHEDMAGKIFGNMVESQMGQLALLLEPSVVDMMRHLKRATQIIYPKDAAYLVQQMNLHAGSTVIEAGTGSGALTTAMAWSVAPTGRVYTYEVRDTAHEIAHKNLKRFDLLPYVEMFHESIRDGFRQSGVDALFLDVREPWLYLEHVHRALRPTGHFASILPTTNQVSTLLEALENAPFACVSVDELMLRSYKAVPDRLRPEDEMIGHTGYLVFARTISSDIDPSRWLSRDRKRYRARQRALELIEESELERAADRAAGGPKYPRMPLP